MVTIKIPAVVWMLGDREQSTTSGVTVVTRPLYYRPKDSLSMIRVGSINPDYAEPLMKVLGKVKK